MSSSAPRSGCSVSLVSPSMSVVTSARGVPTPFIQGSSICKSISETKTGSLEIELESCGDEFCQDSRLLIYDPFELINRMSFEYKLLKSLFMPVLSEQNIA